jgi:hypothetical protein
VRADTGTTGGHTIREHMNMTGQSHENYISNKISNDIQALKVDPYGRRTEGIWDSPEIANNAVRETLSIYSGDIDAYLANPTKMPLILEAFSVDEPVGLAMHVGDVAPSLTGGWRLVIRPASGMPEGFIVQSAFPLLPVP